MPKSFKKDLEMIFLLWIVFALLVGALASKFGRTGGGYFFLSLLISPMLAVILLLIYGKTAKAKAREVLQMKKALAALEQE